MLLIVGTPVFATGVKLEALNAEGRLEGGDVGVEVPAGFALHGEPVVG